MVNIIGDLNMICWSCGNEITPETSSKEHIIPNALFGKLKPKILCKTCNSEFDTIDRSLADDLDSISILVNSKRDRGSAKPLEAKSVSGDIYKIHPKGKAEIKTMVDLNGDKYSIKVSNEEELKKINGGIKKKHTIKSFTFKEFEGYLGPLKLETSTILSDETFRAVSKIAIDYYIYSGGHRDNILDVISYVKTDNDPKGVVWCYYGKEISISKKECEILHSIILIGDTSQNILYCYIELYGALNFIVLLSDSYNGINFTKTYFLDVEERQEVTKKVDVSLSREKIEEIIKRQDLDTKMLEEYMGKVGNILLSKRVHDFIMNLVLKTVIDNPHLEFKNIWDKVQVKFDEYPHWNILALCAYHLKVCCQTGPNCSKDSCDSNEYTYILTSLVIKGTTLFLLLTIFCNICKSSQMYEYRRSLD